MKMLGEQHYGTQKIESSNLEDAIDELTQDFIDQNERAPEGQEKPLTRLHIGKTLQIHQLNNPANMKAVLDALRSVGVKIA